MDLSGDFFQQMIESSRDGIWVFDASGKTLYTNDRCAEFLGRSPEVMRTTDIADVLDEVGREQLAAHLADLRIHTPNPSDVEVTYRRPDGSPVPLLCGESVLCDADGEPVAYVHRLSDDAERRELLSRLSTREEQLGEAQSIARLGSYEMDYTIGVLTWTQQLYSIFDLDPATFVPTPEEFLARVATADRERVRDAVLSAEAIGGEFAVDCRIIRRDGSEVWTRLLGRSVRKDGTLLRTSGTLQDISSVKEAELKLLDAVVLNMLMQVMATAANSATTLREAMQMVRGQLLAHDDWVRAVALEVRREGGKQELVPFLVTADDPEQIPNAYERHVAEEVLRRDGMLFEEELQPDNPSIGCMVSLDGEPSVVFVLTNIGPFERHAMLTSMVEQVTGQLAQVAARERSALDLAEARDAAMEASRLKSEFLATMSHEIRTPLNGVIGLNELLLRTELDAHQRRLASGMQVAGQSLLSLINDILDFSKIEAGEVELERVDFPVRPVVEQVAAIVQSGASDKGLEFTVSVDPDVPARVLGDSTRFGQVLSNLVSNAIKFTHEGGVAIHVGLEESDASGSTLRTSVTDTGIGINAEQMSRLFEPFRQADASTTRTYGGTGLGLAISRQLVQLLDGEIGADSTPGKGSTFWFTARFGAAGTATEATVVEPLSGSGPGARTGRVLLVEDNDINQLVALGLLEALGYSADVADNGARAVEMAASNDYALILMDVHMPGMDGYTASRAIRAAEGSTRVPIVALTASAVIGERERCQAAGMDDLLTKPVSADRLASVLRTYADSPREEVAGAKHEPSRRTGDVLDPTRIEELSTMGERAKALVLRAMDNFASRADDVVADLKAAVRDQDSVAARDLAHQFRGSALNLGANRVAEIALELELAAETGTVTGCEATVAELAVTLERTIDALAAYREVHLVG